MLTMKKRKQEVDKDINNACPQILIPKDTSYVASTLNTLPLRIISKHYPVPPPPTVAYIGIPYASSVAPLKSHPHFAQTYTELSHLLEK